MTWLNRTEKDIHADIVRITQEETGLTSLKEGGVLRGLIETYAKTVYSLYDQVINFFGGQYTYLQASNEVLDLRGTELGLKREEATKAVGNFTVETYQGGSIKTGAWIVAQPSGLRYKVTEEINYTATGFQVPVEAEFPGSAYNILPDADLRFSSVIVGVKSVKATESWIAIPGKERETDSEFRLRIGARWDAQGQDNRPSKYESLALDVAGVNDVKVIRTPQQEAGRVDIIVGSPNGIPSSEVIKSVEEAIEEARLVARDIRVEGANESNHDFILSFTGDATKEEVEDQLRAYLLNLRIGEGVTMRNLYNDALKNLPLDELEYQTPTQDIEIGGYQKIIPTISVTKRSES